MTKREGSVPVSYTHLDVYKRQQQFVTAKAEVEKPFDKEEELTEKTNRLNVLNGFLWTKISSKYCGAHC